MVKTIRADLLWQRAALRAFTTIWLSLPVLIVNPILGFGVFVLLASLFGVSILVRWLSLSSDEQRVRKMWREFFSKSDSATIRKNIASAEIPEVVSENDARHLLDDPNNCWLAEPPPVWHYDDDWFSFDERSQLTLQNCSLCHHTVILGLYREIASLDDASIGLLRPEIIGKRTLPWRLFVVSMPPNEENIVRWMGLVLIEQVGNAISLRWVGKLLYMIPPGKMSDTQTGKPFYFAGSKKHALSRFDDAPLSHLLFLYTIFFMFIPYVFYRLFWSHRQYHNSIPSLNTKYGWTGEWNWVRKISAYPGTLGEVAHTWRARYSLRIVNALEAVW